MKSAFLISEHTGLFEATITAMERISATIVRTGDFAQLQDSSGRLFSLYEGYVPDAEWELRDGPFELAHGGHMPDMLTVHACIVECRWEDLFIEIVQHVTDALGAPAWVLDGNGVIWPTSDVDPSRLQL